MFRTGKLLTALASALVTGWLAVAPTSNAATAAPRTLESLQVGRACPAASVEALRGDLALQALRQEIEAWLRGFEPGAWDPAELALELASHHDLVDYVPDAAPVYYEVKDETGVWHTICVGGARIEVQTQPGAERLVVRVRRRMILG